MRVPLAEHFHSVQGEGLFSGVPMHFLRFPGCNVGRTVADAPVLRIHPKAYGELPILDDPLPEARQCKTFDGRHFWCDTDYSQHFELSIDQLMEETTENVFCFTGGEPLIHQRRPWFRELVAAIKNANLQIHIETSGTVPFYDKFDWVTVSPKFNWDSRPIEKANQLKFLVDDEFDLYEAESIAKFMPSGYVFLSPIFDPNDLVKANVQKCFEILQTHPHWRLQVQWHKWIGAR